VATLNRRYAPTHIRNCTRPVYWTQFYLSCFLMSYKRYQGSLVGVRFTAEVRDCSLLCSVLTAVGCIQPGMQWKPGPLSPVVKRPGHEADHSPPSSNEVKNVWSYISVVQYSFMAWYSDKRAPGQPCHALRINRAMFVSFSRFAVKLVQSRAVQYK
jgi:hypothetical protein